MKPNPKKESKEIEEESRRLALETLRERYCMNCFCLKAECICSLSELKGLRARSDLHDSVQKVARHSIEFEIVVCENGRFCRGSEGIGGGGLRYYG